MKSIVKYGLFASALTIAAFVGHMITKYSYQDSYEKIALQHKNSIGVTEVPVAKTGSPEPIDSPEPISSPERIGSPKAKDNPEPAKSLDRAQSADIKNNQHSQAAAQAAKDKASQASAKTPLAQPPESSKKTSGEPLSKQNLTASQQSSFNDNTSSGRAGAVSGSSEGDVPRESLTGVSTNVNGDMLAILSPLLKLTDGQPLGTEVIEGRALLIVAWASWCGSCREQYAAAEAFKNKLDNPNLDIIVVAMDADVYEARQAVARRKMSSSVVVGTEQFVKQLPLLGLPSAYFADAHGQLQLKILGNSGQDFAIYEQKIRSILAETRANPEKPAAVVNVAKGERGSEL